MTIYTKLYSGQGKGDTWTLPTNTNLNPRAQAVEAAAMMLNGPISVLDIGCGKGINTLGTLNKGGNWTGVDVESAEKISLNISQNSNVRFVQGNFCSEAFRKNLGEFDLIVDQGAALVEVDSREKLKNYLKSIHTMLKPGGRFVALFFHQFANEEGASVNFPDGRKRGLWTPSEVAEVCGEYFQIESGLEYEHAYSYLPGKSNPIGAMIGDSRQITLFQLIMVKK